MDVNLVMLKTDGGHKVFSLPSSVTIIGRRHDCDLYIPLTLVSRKHCQISHYGGTLKIRDLGSHNGTILNGERIDESEIHPGDCLEIGPLKFIFQIDGQPETFPKADAVPASEQETKPIETENEQFATFTGSNEHDMEETMDKEFDNFVDLDSSGSLPDNLDILENDN